ncbi:UNVERIFIED_CONTAM: hypothetical protein Scaly_3033600 [Sesamum calycinum]|uniref:Reverse transcriptase domain-containing protein n=1 Tax=Sesamum calycinum TaxID=2727403 RepID=A0AAW2K6E9_9LAMI
MMDVSQGYHQIMLAPKNRKRVSFITSASTFYYVAISFGLKNIGATYQRLVDKIFCSQIRRNVEVCIDDMLVKSKEAKDHITDLEETFSVFRNYRLKLNLEKYVFGVQGGRFLDSWLPKEGLRSKDGHAFEANLGKVGYFRTIGEMTGRIKREHSRNMPPRLKNDYYTHGWIFHNSRQWCKHSHHFALWKRFRIVVVKFRFKASKDEAEHEAFVIDMRMAHDLGYHQIMPAPEDRKKVSFITTTSTFSYVAISFG